MYLNFKSESHLVRLKSYIKKRYFLVLQLTKREIHKKYRGSLLGFLWTFVNPLVLFITYSFLFSVVFNAKFESNDEKSNIAIMVYCGVILHLFFSECIMSAPSLIYSNSNYVKKVVFPLEILIVPVLLYSLLNLIINIGLLLIILYINNGYLYKEILLLPFLLLPLIIFIIGLMLIFASLGVFIRDISQLSAILNTVMLFVSGVFFTINDLPEKYQSILSFNPLAQAIASIRFVMLKGPGLDYYLLMKTFCVAFTFLFIGITMFKKLRKYFADVL